MTCKDSPCLFFFQIQFEVRHIQNLDNVYPIMAGDLHV